MCKALYLGSPEIFVGPRPDSWVKSRMVFPHQTSQIILVSLILTLSMERPRFSNLVFEEFEMELKLRQTCLMT